MIKLVLTDMDGTLLDSRKKMPDKTIETIRALQSRGARFAVASGREYSDLRAFFSELAEEIIFVANNGTLICDGSLKIYEDAFSRDAALSMFDKLRLLPNTAVVLRTKEYNYWDAAATTNPNTVSFVSRYFPDIRIANPLELIQTEPILEFLLYCEKGTKEALRNMNHLLEDVQLVPSQGGHWIDIYHPSAGKGAAVKILQNRLGITKAECMCFGDYWNDADMIRYSGESYAMENALPEIRAMAKHIAPHNDAGGVITVLRSYLQLDE